jgi:anti-anti-sigma regulatory factor
VTNPKSPKKRKSASRVRPKGAAVSTAKAVPAPAAAMSPAAASAVNQPAAPAVNQAAPVNVVADGICVQLEPGLEVKDAEGVHRLLLAALGDGRAVTVDVGRLHAVDTAGAQLLLAFQGEASRRGVTIEFRGESAPLNHTLAVLGLRGKFPFAALHG